jgi:8-oxo-dGTP pyrophosphatase MutT (NUDIX family)
MMTLTSSPDLLPATPAATLVLFRDRSSAPPELLMVERASSMAFAGGAVVFPGGRVDADDHVIAARQSRIDPDCAAARVAAIRETIEESGIPIGLSGVVPKNWLQDARVALHNCQPFSDLIDQADLTLDYDALIPFARWRPNFREARIFDTRFYIARAPDDLPDAVVDATENVRTFWSSALSTIEAAAREEVFVIFPTQRNLERLAQFESFDAAYAHSHAFPVQLLIPWIEERDGEKHLCIPDNMGYPITSQPLTTAKRSGK